MLRGRECGCPPVGDTPCCLSQSVSLPVATAFSQLEATTCTYYIPYAIMLSGVSVFRIHLSSSAHSHQNLPFDWITPPTAASSSSPHDLTTTIHHAHHQSNSPPSSDHTQTPASLGESSVMTPMAPMHARACTAAQPSTMHACLEDCSGCSQTDDDDAAAAQATGPHRVCPPARLLCSCQISIKPKILTRLPQGYAWIFSNCLWSFYRDWTIVLMFLVSWNIYASLFVLRRAAHVGQRTLGESVLLPTCSRCCVRHCTHFMTLELLPNSIVYKVLYRCVLVVPEMLAYR
jgi:hypothetical protein